MFPRGALNGIFGKRGVSKQGPKELQLSFWRPLKRLKGYKTRKDQKGALLKQPKHLNITRSSSREVRTRVPDLFFFL